MKKRWVLVGFVLFVFFAGNVIADEIDELIGQLKSLSSEKRLAAAKELGNTKDPRAVKPLASVMRDDRSWEVRLAAEHALVSIGSASTEALIQVLKDKTCFPRRRAARALEQIKDPCSTEALMKASREDADCCVRRFAARALGEIKDPIAARFLDNEVTKRDVEVIIGAYKYYIRKGEPGTEPVLIQAMQKCSYDKNMVLDFASCGNDQLKQAAEKIAKEEGYPLPADWSGPRWGKI
jgi:hypothetical protein